MPDSWQVQCHGALVERSMKEKVIFLNILTLSSVLTQIICHKGVIEFPVPYKMYVFREMSNEMHSS